MRRRTFISTLGVGAVTAIAGCSDTDDTGPSPTPSGGDNTPSGAPESEADTPETTETLTEGTEEEQVSYDSYPFGLLNDNQEQLVTGLPHFDGFDDRRGDGMVTVEQGRTGEGETYTLFHPPAVWIEAGQTVEFSVAGDNEETGDYNVQHHTSSTDRFVSNDHDENGEFSHTFQSAGVYMYECSANRTLGGYGIIVVGRPE